MFFICLLFSTLGNWWLKDKYGLNSDVPYSTSTVPLILSLPMFIAWFGITFAPLYYWVIEPIIESNRGEDRKFKPFCPNCRNPIAIGNYCMECGAHGVNKLPKRFCPKCGHPVNVGIYCIECGMRTAER